MSTAIEDTENGDGTLTLDKRLTLDRGVQPKKPNLIRRLSKRIRRNIDEKTLDESHSDQELIKNLSPNSPKIVSKVQKSNSLNRLLKNRVSTRRRNRLGSNTISKCCFDLKDFEEYSRSDIPLLAEHFRKCNDPTHLLPHTQESHLKFSSKPPFVKVKKEEIPDEKYADDDREVDPAIQAIIDLICKRAEEFNSAPQKKAGRDEEIRQLVLGVEKNMHWYMLNQVWGYIKTTSQNINWTELLKMLI